MCITTPCTLIFNLWTKCAFLLSFSAHLTLLAFLLIQHFSVGFFSDSVPSFVFFGLFSIGEYDLNAVCRLYIYCFSVEIHMFLHLFGRNEQKKKKNYFISFNQFTKRLIFLKNGWKRLKIESYAHCVLWSILRTAIIKNRSSFIPFYLCSDVCVCFCFYFSLFSLNFFFFLFS